MQTYTFTHNAKPKVKERPRAAPNGKRLYTPTATLEAQASLAAAYQGPLFEGPVGMWMDFHPDRTEITIMEWLYPPSPLRGDTDNYSKLASDALEGLAYPNDRQVMACFAAKWAS